MNHDIFISYSHKNITAAQAICHELEDAGIKCWMAPRDIPVGAKYASVISKAIVHSKIVVLVFSDYSARSPWVESEINIAFSNRKTIIPYKIDKTNYEEFDEFYLMLNNRHWIEAYPDYKTRFKELVSIVAQTLGRTISANKPTMSTPTPAPAPMPTPTPTQKQSSETLMPTSKPNNLKRYWWVALCVLAVGCAMWYISTDKLESEELRAEKARIEKENETLKHDNAELQHSNAELQNSNSDLQKNINDFKAKEAQQANNKKKENQTVKSPTQKQPETKSSVSTQKATTTSPPKVEQKSEQIATTQKADAKEVNTQITQPQEQVKQTVAIAQTETSKEEIVKKDEEYTGLSEREKYLLSLPDDEFVIFKEDGKYGFKLKSSGEIVIPLKYDYAWSFGEGLARVALKGKLDGIGGIIDRDIGFVDKTGKEVIPLKYDDARSFSEGVYLLNKGKRECYGFTVDHGKWGVIDKTGKEIVPLKYDDVHYLSEGLAMVELNGKEGYIDETGKEVVPLKYDDVGAFHDGLAHAKLNGKEGFIDKTGKEVIPLEYDDVTLFKKGKAKVSLNGKTFYIDKNGNRVK